jgi:IS30 family transposase
VEPASDRYPARPPARDGLPGGGEERGREAYRAHDADAAAYERARRPKAGKLRCRPQLLAAVQRGLELEWSPEQVSQRLRLEYPDDPSM